MKWRKNAIFNGNYRRELHENPSKSYDWQCIYFHLLESFVWCEISCRKLCAIIFLLSFCRTDRLTNFQFGFFPLHAFECTSWSITISVYCWIYGVRRFSLNWKEIDREREREKKQLLRFRFPHAHLLIQKYYSSAGFIVSIAHAFRLKFDSFCLCSLVMLEDSFVRPIQWDSILYSHCKKWQDDDYCSVCIMCTKASFFISKFFNEMQPFNASTQWCTMNWSIDGVRCIFSAVVKIGRQIIRSEKLWDLRGRRMKKKTMNRWTHVLS